MSSRVTIAFVALIGALIPAAPATAQHAAPGDPPWATIRPGGGPAGMKLEITVTGASCPNGVLVATWDTGAIIGGTEQPTSPDSAQVFPAIAPKDVEGTHTVDIRCDRDGAVQATAQFTLTNDPFVTVTPVSVLPGSPFAVDLTNFRCANEAFLSFDTEVRLDGVVLKPPYAVPADAKPGRHVVTGRCAWPDASTVAPTAVTPLWVPALLTLNPNHGAAGSAAQLTGTGFPCEVVRVLLDGVQLTEAKTTPNRVRSGDFTASLAIPAAAEPREHVLSAACPGPPGARPEIIFTVDALTGTDPATTSAPVPRDPRRLGVWLPIAVIAVLALAALLGGAYLVRRSARRRPRKPGVEVRLSLGTPQVRVREEAEQA